MLDLYAAVIRKVESGDSTWASDFSELKHMILTMRLASKDKYGDEVWRF